MWFFMFLITSVGLAVVSLLCSVVKGSCEMVTAVEQDGLSVVMSSCTFFDEAGICLLKNLYIF
jgi:hypothetical protein